MVSIRDDSSTEGKVDPDFKPDPDFKAYPVDGVNDTSVSKRGGKTFDNDTLQANYAPIEGYEGAHRYDPNFEWEPQEEKRLVRKVSHFLVN